MNTDLAPLHPHWRPPRDGTLRPLYRFALAVVRPLLPRVHRLRVHGREWVPAAGPTIVVASHDADIDPPFLALALAPRQAITLTADRHFRTRWLGWLLSGLGCVPVALESADLRALRYAMGQLRLGRLVVIYPEGRPANGGELQPFRDGAGMLALVPGVTVVPAAIWGAHRIVKARWFPIGRGPVHVRFGSPVALPEHGSRRERAARLTAECRAVIEHLRSESIAADARTER